MPDYDKIIQELKEERDHIDAAIARLTALDKSREPQVVVRKRKPAAKKLADTANKVG